MTSPTGRAPASCTCLDGTDTCRCSRRQGGHRHGWAADTAGRPTRLGREHGWAADTVGPPTRWAAGRPPVARGALAQPAAPFLRASACATSALTWALPKRSDALAYSDAVVVSDWLRPNTMRWRSVVGAG